MPNEAMAATLMSVEGLTKVHSQRRFFSRKEHRVVAVDDVSLEISEGQTYGIVGASGSGKSTLALCMAALEQPTAGTVRFRGNDIFALRGDELKSFRRSAQLVLQDSASALNPLFTAIEIVCEPLKICGIGSWEEQRATALGLMRELELSEALAVRRPQQLSGGQRQRLAIARALTLKPELLIFDEVLTGLDVPVQKQFLALLSRIRKTYAFTSIFISHDLRLVRSITSRVAVMNAGRIVESGATCEVFKNPQHAHTRSLLDAMPGPRLTTCLHAGGD